MALQQKAKKLGLKGKAADRYVYGTMQKRGMMSNKKGSAPKKSLGDMMKSMM